MAKILSSNFEKKQMYREIATIMFLSRFITPSFDVKKYHFFSSVITQETLSLLHRFASGLVRMKLFCLPLGTQMFGGSQSRSTHFGHVFEEKKIICILNFVYLWEFLGIHSYDRYCFNKSYIKRAYLKVQAKTRYFTFFPSFCA